MFSFYTYGDENRQRCRIICNTIQVLCDAHGLKKIRHDTCDLLNILLIALVKETAANN